MSPILLEPQLHTFLSKVKRVVVLNVSNPLVWRESHQKLPNLQSSNLPRPFLIVEGVGVLHVHPILLIVVCFVLMPTSIDGGI